jgi:hypothetical protein
MLQAVSAVMYTCFAAAAGYMHVQVHKAGRDMQSRGVKAVHMERQTPHSLCLLICQHADDGAACRQPARHARQVPVTPDVIPTHHFNGGHGGQYIAVAMTAGSLSDNI